MSVFESPEQAQNKKHSFAQRQQYLIDGQSRVIKGMLFVVDLGNRRILFPSSAWKDSMRDSRVMFRCQNSDPYMITGITQNSVRLLDESGFSWP